MSEWTHKPGPWFINEHYPEGLRTRYVESPTGTVCEVSGNSTDLYLIAAAPDMLATLERLLGWFDTEAELVRETGTGSTEGELIDEAVAIKSIISKCRKP